MQVQPVPFTASGLVGTAAFSGQIDSPLTGGAFQPAYMDNTAGVIAVPAIPQRAVGFAYDGFTKVVLYNGTDNTGDIVAVGGAAGSYSWNYEVNFNKGLYVEVTGSGRGTVWLA
jgi:hypothetical protein